MFDSNPPAWRSDAKWICAILAVIALALAVPLVTLSQLSTSDRAVPILEGLLRFILLPDEGDQSVGRPLADTVRERVELTPNGQLELLPGTGVYAGSPEIPQLSAQEALARVARDLSTMVITDGAIRTAERLRGSPVERQLVRFLEGPAREVMRTSLASQLLPAGLDNGSRLANWRLQAQQNPGEPVQPIVGVFVRIPPAELEPLGVQAIGERVVAALADIVLEEGLPAARESVSNPELLELLDRAAREGAAERLLGLFEVLLLPWEATLVDRLNQARAVLLMEAEESVAGRGGVVSAAELAGLTSEEADALVLRRLAEVTYRGGSSQLLEAVNDSRQAGRIAATRGLLDLLTSRGHAEYLRWAWMSGGIAILLAVAVALLSRGWGRVGNPGGVLAIASAGGLLLSLRLADLVSAEEASVIPSSPAPQSVLDPLARLWALTGTDLPSGVLEILVRNHLIMVTLGLGLLLLSVLLRAVRGSRSRRRSLI